MELDLGIVAAAARGRILVGPSGLRASGASIDSRTVGDGELFFAIVGPNNDGHRFIQAAVARGAAAVVVSDASAVAGLAAGIAAVLVEDTTRALQDVAADVRRRTGVQVVGITGSVGKTTTKELTGLLLGRDRPTHCSPGNLNNHYGLPLALLAMPGGTRTCVLELGISTPGEMDRLLEVAAPDVGLVTWISPAHVGNFASLDQLAVEKLKLLHGSRLAHVNVDDPRQWASRTELEVPWVPYGVGEAADSGLRLIAQATRGLDGSTLTLRHGDETFEVACPLPGAHQGRNLLAAAAIALDLGVSPERVVEGAAAAAPAPHRGVVLRIGGATVVDDTYNANPKAMEAALDLLSGVETSGRRIFVAGDMFELGASAAEEHRRLGELAAARRVDVLVGVGEESARAVTAAREAGLTAEHLPDASAAGEWLARGLRDGDVVIVKGSRGMALDRAVDRLLERRGAA